MFEKVRSGASEIKNEQPAYDPERALWSNINIFILFEHIIIEKATSNNYDNRSYVIAYWTVFPETAVKAFN